MGWGYRPPTSLTDLWGETPKNLNSIAPNDCSIRGGGPFLLLSNVLDTKGRVWELFGNLGAKVRILCIIINFKLTSILAPSVL